MEAGIIKMVTSFIVDINAGKLAKYLRIMGYDTLLFREQDDSIMVKTALRDSRIILTKDGEILKRRLVSGGKIRAIHLQSDDSHQQALQVIALLHLDAECNAFSRCIECNALLLPVGKDEVHNMVPPHVFQTQNHYMRCPGCSRIYWKGTHWQAMCRQLKSLAV
jgi:uncharacterized protein with PIN domain